MSANTVPGPGALDDTGTWHTIWPLVIESDSQSYRVSSPHLAKRYTVTPAVIRLLLDCRDGLGQVSLDDPVVARLVDLGLITNSSEQVPEPWDRWGCAAWSFHRRTRDLPFIDGSEPTEDAIAEVASVPRPSSIRGGEGPVVLLPRVAGLRDVRFVDVLEGRRTHRHYTGDAMRLDDLAVLLRYSFGPIRFADAGPLGSLPLKAAASGGARHETEAFVVVSAVEDLDPGLYHYDWLRHGLEPIDDSVTVETLEDLTFHQGFFKDACIGVLLGAITERMRWKYHGPRTYRFLFHNAGHVAQVFSMTAHALGLGASLTGAIKDSRADELLGLDGVADFTTFAMACGVPERQPSGLPRSIRVAGRPPAGGY